MGSALSGGGRPTPYAELAAVIEALPLLLREARRQRQLSARAVARQLDCGVSTVLRIEDGEGCALSNAVAVLRWLDRAPGGGGDRG